MFQVYQRDAICRITGFGIYFRKTYGNVNMEDVYEPPDGDKDLDRSFTDGECTHILPYGLMLRVSTELLLIRTLS